MLAEAERQYGQKKKPTKTPYTGTFTVTVKRPINRLFASSSWRGYGCHLIVERLDCKRPILWLASSKILTPHPPHRPASGYPPPLVRGEDTLAGWRGGWGVNILKDARHSSVF